MKNSMKYILLLGISTITFLSVASPVKPHASPIKIMLHYYDQNKNYTGNSSSPIQVNDNTSVEDTISEILNQAALDNPGYLAQGLSVKQIHANKIGTTTGMDITDDRIQKQKIDDVINTQSSSGIFVLYY